MIITADIKKIGSKLSSPVAKNIFWLSLDKVFKLIVGLVVGVWVARYLGPSQWGELNYVLAFVSIIATLDRLGMDGFLTKEILENPDQKNSILGTSFIMRLVIIPFGIAAILIYFYILDLKISFYYLLAFLSLNIIITPFDLIDVDFQSRLQSRLTVISKNSAYVIGALARIYLLVSHKSLLWFAAATGLESLFSYIFLTISYQRANNIFDWTFSMKLVKKLWNAGWPFTLSSIAIVLYMRMDQVMLGSMVDEKELGYFSSATRVSDIFVFLPMAISGSILPYMIEAKKNGREYFLKKIQFLINWMARLSIAPALLVTFFADDVIKVLYGVEYMPASGILIVHIWSLVPMFLGIATSQYLVIEGLQKYSLYRTLVGLTTNVILNLILIPKYGAFGAALATTIAQFSAAILTMSIFEQTRVMFYLQMKSFLMIFNFKK